MVAEDMSEQSNERELFESWLLKEPRYTATWDETRKRYVEFAIDLGFDAFQGARAPLLARIAELEAKVEAADENEGQKATDYPYGTYGNGH